MKKIIRVADEKKQIVQITTVDERWYIKPDIAPATGLPVYKYVPSVTWITEYYPKGIGFYKWLADKSWDEAEAIKVAAGDKGSKVHYAIGDLLEGKEVAMEAQYPNPTTEKLEELSLQEYECLMSFVAFWGKFKPRIIAREMAVFNDKDNYAGTIDLLCEIDYDGEKVVWLIDFKTSQYIWPSHELQVSAYLHALPKELILPVMRVGILQLGYNKNKDKYKFTPIDDKFDLFLTAKKIWANENNGDSPRQKDYPFKLSLKKGGETNE